MKNLLTELRLTPATNDKIKILQKYHKNNDTFVELMTYALSPFVTFGVNKIKIKKSGTKKLTDKKWNDFTDILHNLEMRKLTGNLAKETVVEFIEQFTPKYQDLLLCILKKDLKAGVSLKTVNKVLTKKEVIEEFTIQRANEFLKYTKKKNQAKHLFASPKYNGIRGYYDEEKGMLSRNGHPIIGFDHLTDELVDFCKTYGKYDRFEFTDGEFYTHDLPFQHIQGAVLSTVNIDIELKKKIDYHIFVTGDEWNNTEEMVEHLMNIKEEVEKTYRWIKIVPYEKVKNDVKLIQKKAEKLTLQGYEGIMLRHPEKWIDNKKSDALLKYKLFEEGDFTITGLYKGEKGKQFENTLGGITVEGIWKGKKVVSDCGSGFKALPEFLDNRDWFWKNRKRIKRERPTVEIKFKGLMLQKKDGTYAFDHPVYKKLKQDR